MKFYFYFILFIYFLFIYLFIAETILCILYGQVVVMIDNQHNFIPAFCFLFFRTNDKFVKFSFLV